MKHLFPGEQLSDLHLLLIGGSPQMTSLFGEDYVIFHLSRKMIKIVIF